MKIKKEITRGLGAVSACLLTVVSIGTPVAEAYEGRLNTVLGIETTKTVSDEGLDVDTDYYKSDYGTDIYDGDKLQQLEDDAAAQAVAEQEEGYVLLKNDNNALPLAAGSSITLFGQNSIESTESVAGSTGFGGPQSYSGPFYSYHSTANSTQELVTYLGAMESVYDVNQTMVKAYQESGYMRVKSVDDPQIGEAPADFYTDELKNSWRDQYNDAAVVMLTRQASYRKW